MTNTGLVIPRLHSQQLLPMTSYQKYERAEYYEAKRISIETFQVAFNEIFNGVYEFDKISKSAEDDVMLAKIPLFKRVRVVTINENGIMKVSVVSMRYAGCFVSIKYVSQINLQRFRRKF